jgi:8-oxo-dGTP pyrophosphatase MutT (NUDIX family)
MEFAGREPVFHLTPHADDLPETVSCRRGNILTDFRLVSAFANCPLNVVWQDDKFRLTGELRESAAYVLRRSSGAKLPFNGPCVRLETDLSSLHVNNLVDVRLRPADFFDALCSNELTRWSITRSGLDWDFHHRYLLDSHNRVIALSQSELANIVGVSTLAITTDDHVLLVLQSGKSSASAQLWAPSGSGSLEPQDVSNQDRLSDVVLSGAVRELREECGLTPDSVLSSQLLGYGRWLERGAKPEFVCVTALSCTSNDVLRHPSYRDRSEKHWTTAVECIPLNLAVSAADDWSGPEARSSAAHRLIGNSDRVISGISVPLQFSLEVLALALSNQQDLLSNLRASARKERLV